MVRVEGLEPPCPCERWILSSLRLPFRHTRCRILLIELPHQDGNRTSTHQCSAGSDVDRRRIGLCARRRTFSIISTLVRQFSATW